MRRLGGVSVDDEHTMPQLRRPRRNKVVLSSLAPCSPLQHYSAETQLQDVI